MFARKTSDSKKEKFIEIWYRLPKQKSIFVDTGMPGEWWRV
jgi:hypothetical protein